MQQLRKLRNRRLGAGIALMGLLCQIVLAFVHVPGAVASQSITQAGYLENVICTPTGFKRVVIDLKTGLPIDGSSSDQDSDDVSVTCVVCASLANIALALSPDISPLLSPSLENVRVGIEPHGPVVGAVTFRASQRAPPFQA